MDSKNIPPKPIYDPPLVNDDSFKAQIEDGTLLNIKRSDLLPSAHSNPSFEEKDSAGHDLPIFVHVGSGSTEDQPGVEVHETEKGRRYILINEGYHQWTEAYVQERILKSDNTLNKDPDLSRPEDFLKQYRNDIESLPEAGAIEQRYKSILDSVWQQAQEMGIGTPEIRIGSGEMDQMVSEQSKEGTPYIIISKTSLMRACEGDGVESIKGLIGHELRHIVNGDNTPAGLIRLRNIYALRQAEERADLEGAGPLGSHNPQAYAQRLMTGLKKGVFQYNDRHPDALIAQTVTPEGLQKISDWVAHEVYPGHPAPLDRIAALQDEAAVMAQYEKTHNVTSHADREAESRFVVDKVEQDMKGKWTLPMDAPTSQETPLGLTSDQHQQIGQINDTLNRAYAQITLPQAPDKRPDAPAAAPQRG